MYTEGQVDREPLADSALVERARGGSKEAFGELVRRHRSRALGWANALTHDGQLAEDVVQEALLKAFLRLETLIDATRFRQWLQRIVRNQANMKLRRGGPFGKEKPFSGFGTPAAIERNGSDLDRLLYRLCASPMRHGEQDPQALLMRRELYAGIFDLLRCLTQREREIFEAHVFRHLSAAEIARLCGASVGSVYTSISRARTKVQRERIRVYFQGYALDKKQAGRTTRCVLTKPIPF